MAIIYSYPETLELLPTDMLIGTATIRVAGKRKNITKNFTLELLKNFILNGYTNVQWGSITGTLSNQTDLQAALNAKQNILSGTGFVKISGTTISYDNTTYYPYPTGTTSQYVRGDGSLATLPSSAIPTLNQVLTAGNVSLLDAKIGVLYGYDNVNSDYGTLEFYDSGVVIKAATTNKLLFYNDGIGSVRFSNGSYTPILNFAGVGDNLYTFQNANGTLAFLSDIPSLAGYVPTSRTLTINGTTYDLTANRTWNVGTVTSVSATSPITSSGGTTPTISTSMATNKLIGRSTAGTGVMEEITVGSGLTLSAGTLSATASGSYVPYTGATGNVDLGTHTLLAHDLVINHPSGSGVAASITKGGSGEALTVIKTSGSGNAASITGGTTLISELNLTTDLADAYIASAATWNAKFTLPSLTSGSVLFSNGTTIAQDNANFFWDDSNNRLGIGITTPYASLTIQDSTSNQIVLKGASGIEGISSFSGGSLVSLDATLGPYFQYQYSALTMIPALGFITYGGFEVLTGNITTGYIPRKAPIGVENSLIYDDGTNVGIGTIIPTTALDVNGVITATGGNSTSWNAKQDTITLTTTGSSGPATLVGTTLNIPEYAGGGGTTPIDIQLFTSSGVWTKPAGATLVEVYLVSGGGGGGAGRRGATSTARYGGGGGASGAITSAKMDASSLSSTENIWIGTGGNGGAAVSVDNTNGTTGSSGLTSYFGGSGTGATAKISTQSGVGGAGGSNTSSSSSSSFNSYIFGIAVSANTYSSGSLGASGFGGSISAFTLRALAAGSYGGGLTAANVPNAGQGNRITGGASAQLITTAFGGAVNGGAGNAGSLITNSASNLFYAGGGSGGGSGDTLGTVAGGTGGNGAPGAGGAGGGASTNGANSGAGGRGGDGFCMIVTYF